MKTSPPLNLNGTVLRVSVNKVFPFCNFKIANNGEITMEESIEFQYLKLLMKTFNFNVQLIDMKNHWGVKANGTWDGVIGMVNSSRAEFGMCELSPAYDRLEVVDFGHNIMEDALSFITCAPKPKQYPFLVAIPFTASVWTLIFSTIFILSIFQYQNSKDKLSSLVFNHCAIVLRQSISFTSNLPRSRILFCVWLLLSVILSTSYIAVYHAMLTLVEYEDSLDTPEAIQKALAEDSVILLQFKYAYYSNLIHQATPNSSRLFYEIKMHIQRDKLKRTYTIEDMIVNIFRWKNKKPLLFTAHYVFMNQLNAFFQGFQSLHISRHRILSSNIGMAFPHNSSLLLPFNSVITRIFESGISQHWVWRTQSEATKKFRAHPVEYFRSLYDIHLPELANPKPQPITADVRTLFLSDFKVVFYLWLIGLAISSIAFLFETIRFMHLDIFGILCLSKH